MGILPEIKICKTVDIDVEVNLEDVLNSLESKELAELYYIIEKELWEEFFITLHDFYNTIRCTVNRLTKKNKKE